MLDIVLKKFHKKINGIIQAGAHIGQEVDIFLKYSDSNIYLFEPNKEAFEILKKYAIEKNIFIYNFGLGNNNEKKTLFVSDNKNGVSSSVLEPKLHLKYFPEYKFSKKIDIDIKKFSDLKGIVGNFLMMDVQGYELEVLKGFEQKLNNIDYIFTEVSMVELYDGGVNINDLDDFLENKNFIRSHTSLVSNIPTGDAFYINTNLIGNQKYFFYKLKSRITKSSIFRMLNSFRDPKKLSYHLKNKLKNILNLES